MVANFYKFAPLFVALKLCFAAEDSDSKAGIFEGRPFHLLRAAVVANLDVFSDIDCALPCLRDERCLSFNIAVNSKPEGFRECQLLSSDGEKAKELLIANPGFHHYSRKPPPCSPNPCLNSGRCVEWDGGNGYHCECPPGFTGKQCETVKWLKLNKSPVSFGALGDSFGPFNITTNGKIITFKLVHISGYVTCTKSLPKTRSNWFCNNDDGSAHSRLCPVVTDATNKVVLPENSQFADIPTLTYMIPGYNTMSPELIYRNFTTPREVTAGQEYRVWYCQDLRNSFEDSNEGIEFIDVYGLYV